MADIKFTLENQLLTKQNEVILSSGDSGTDTCFFTFDSNWDDFIKTAVFYQHKTAPQYAILDADNTCKIPALAMNRAGTMHVGVFGVRAGKVMLTSTVERVEVRQGAASSTDMELEPADDVFLCIVANYQELLNRCSLIDADYQSMIETMRRQNELLEKLNAYEVVEVMDMLEEMTLEMDGIRLLGDEFRKNFRINNITVMFNEDGIYKYMDERITTETLCEVFFDTLCVAAASAAIVSVETFNGYIQFQTTYEYQDALMCSIYCMGV